MDAIPASRAALAFLLGVSAALVSRRLRFLTRGGSVAAGVLAFLLYAIGSLPWLLPMALFFLSSSLLSGISERIQPAAGTLFEKGNERDASQVIANGGVGCLLVLVSPWQEGGAVYAAYLGSIAAAAADTWGTELGMLSRRPPRLITTLAVVEAGTSGAVSGTGLFGAACGAVVIAGCGGVWLPPGPAALTVAAAGLGGSLLDSLLGALAQAQYRCAECGRMTERKRHCGAGTKPGRGLRWMTNDCVNLVANGAGALFAALLARLMA